MTEDELIIHIAEVSTAIKNILLTGQKYEVGTGPSKRIFEMASLSELREYQNQLKQDLAGLQGCDGVQVGF